MKNDTYLIKTTAKEIAQKVGRKAAAITMAVAFAVIFAAGVLSDETGIEGWLR